MGVVFESGDKAIHRKFHFQNMTQITSESLLIIGERSCLERFNYNNLPPYTKLEIKGSSDLANLKISFKTLQKRQIFINIGKIDFIKGTSLNKYAVEIEKFISNLKSLVDPGSINICYVKPRYHPNGIYEDEKTAAHYIANAYSAFLTNFPQTILFTQDGKDIWVSQAYRSLFHDMIKKPEDRWQEEQRYKQLVDLNAMDQQSGHTSHSRNTSDVKSYHLVPDYQDKISNKEEPVYEPVQPLPPPSVKSRKSSSSSSSSSSSKKSSTKKVDTNLEEINPTPKLARSYIYCRNLPSGGVDKIDPYVKIVSESNSIHVLNAKTEVLDNIANPVFHQFVEFEYTRPQDILKFKIFDSNTFKDKLVDEIPITMVSLNLVRLNHTRAEGRANHFNYMEFDLPKGGTICIQTLNHQEIKEVVKFKALARNLPNKKQDPYFEISLDGPEGLDFLAVYQSKYKKNTAQPDWDAAVVPLARLGNHGLNSTFNLKVWDFDKKSSNDYIGASRKISFRQAIENDGILEEVLYNQAKPENPVRGMIKLFDIDIDYHE